MAVLRKQRELLSKLRELEIEDINATPEKWDLKDDFVANVNLMSTGTHYVFENDLVLRLIGEKTFNKKKAREFNEWKKYLDSCIEDKLVDSTENIHRNKENIENSKNLLTESQLLSKRLIQVSSGKGMEMLDRYHYWFQWIPSIFPEPVRIFTSVIIALLTSGAIWLYLINHIPKI